jgi:hypothetical protein
VRVSVLDHYGHHLSEEPARLLHVKGPEGLELMHGGRCQLKRPEGLLSPTCLRTVLYTVSYRYCKNYFGCKTDKTRIPAVPGTKNTADYRYKAEKATKIAEN